MKKYILPIALMLFILLSGCGADPSAGTSESTVPETLAESQEPVIPETEVTEPESTQTEPTIPEQPSEPLVLRCSEINLLQPGDSVQLYAGNRDRSQIQWTVDDPDVASVEDGVVTFLADGETVVRAITIWEEVSCHVVCDPERDRRLPVMKPAEVEMVQESFFDDVVFMGDSVTTAISAYAMTHDCFSGARYLCRYSYGIHNGLTNYMRLSYGGESYRFENAVAATGASRLIIMLGINDIGVYGVDATISDWHRYLERIRSVCPEIDVYIVSLPPMWPGSEYNILTNANIDRYNSCLQELAIEEDCHYIDIASYMKDADGALAKGLSSDSYVHLSDEGISIFVKVLKAYTDYR